MDGSPRLVAHRFGRFTLDLGRGALLTEAGSEIHLRAKSFALLRLFVENAGRLLERDRIMAAIWPNVVVSDDGLVQCVRDIRRALGDEGQRVVRTVARRGYIFLAEVAAAVSPVFTDHSASIEDDRSETAVLARDLKSNPPAFSLVVTPFESLGAHPDDRRLAAVLTEDLTIDLARVPGLCVVDSVSMCASGTHPEREAGVRYVVAGSLRRAHGGGPPADDTLLVTARLVDAEAGVCLWADRFSIELTGAEMAWSEMVGRLVNAIESSVANSAAVCRELEIDSDSRANRLCLRGWAIFHQIHTINSFRRARICFEQALRIDPEASNAKIGLAMIGAGSIANFWSPLAQESEAQIEQLLFEGIDGGGQSGRALLTLGMLRRLQDRAAESRTALQMAIASDPNNAWAIRQLGYTHAHSGETAAAAVELGKSLRLDPYGGGVAVIYQMLGHCHLLLDNAEAAIEPCRKSVTLNPWLVSSHLHLASALASSGELKQAKATMVRAIELKPEWQSVAAIRACLPYSDPRYISAMNDGFFSGLRRAGLPAA